MDELNHLRELVTEQAKRIQTQEEHIQELQEAVGRWRRQAKRAKPHFQYVQQRHERGQHYISVPVEGLPADTSLHEAQEYIRDHVLPLYHPYQYYNCYSSKRYGGWVTTLTKKDDVVNMNKKKANIDASSRPQ